MEPRPTAAPADHAPPDPHTGPRRGEAGGLILGLAAGYHFGDVSPFILSLRETGFAGRCVLFVSPTTRDVDRMREHGVEAVPFERSGPLAHLPYNAWRYVLYRDYLARGPARHGPILLTDVRDVLFQADPFSVPWSPGLHVTLEDRRMTIGQCPHMRHWMGGHLGEAAWQSIADRPISCSGTTVADHDAMLAYLDLMLPLLATFSPAPRMAGYDQGVHNHLLHTGALAAQAPVTVLDNTGPILTLGYTEGEPAVDGQGRVLCAPLPGGAPAPAAIVHQYDRKPGLHATVRARYAPRRAPRR